MKRLLSFLFGFSGSCPYRYASQYADFRFRFQIFLFFALFQEVGYYKKLQYITKLRGKKQQITQIIKGKMCAETNSTNLAGVDI